MASYSCRPLLSRVKQTYLFDIFRSVRSRCIISDNFKNNYLLLPQFFLSSTHALFFKAFKDPVKYIWHGMHYFIARLLHPKISGKNDGHGQLRSPLLHISCALKQLGTNTNKHESFSNALLHISCVLKWSGTSANNNGYFSTALLHISSVLRCSGTSFWCQGLSPTAFSHISFVLKWSETSANKHGSF